MTYANIQWMVLAISAGAKTIPIKPIEVINPSTDPTLAEMDSSRFAENNLGNTRYKGMDKIANKTNAMVNSIIEIMLNPPL